MFKNFLNFVFELVKIVVISLIIIIPVRYFLIQPFYVKGASMEPNFHDHEYLIVNEIKYRFLEPERGDVIVFKYPINPQEYFIKRVIGLPGEKIQIKDGDIHIYNADNPQGEILKEPYLPSGLKTYGLSKEAVSLGKDEYFVLGDNRNSSKDSRSFGPVKRSFIVGRVLLRGWPFNKAGFFKEIKYQF
ncbi:MAG TPA: signal peptidase I [Ignavibacteria bacterium]|nr:signal peptidase I [Ignavibacteria bacterium]